MSRADASELLRANLLEGSSIMLAVASPPPGESGEWSEWGPSGESLTAAVRAACAALGASVSDCRMPCGRPAGPDEAAIDEAAIDGAVDRALKETGNIDLLLLDAGGLFARVAGQATGSEREHSPERDGARMALTACLEASWSVTRAVANRAFLARERGGRIVYLAPVPDAGQSEVGGHADAARAGLENLSRTLSIEWARHAITAVTIAPGASTTAAEVAALTAYLASPAGAYFSGCQFDLRGPAGG